MKKTYEAPVVVEYGTVASLTHAIGGSGIEDQSDYPSQFPPDHGSFDVCNNNDPDSTC